MFTLFKLKFQLLKKIKETMKTVTFKKYEFSGQTDIYEILGKLPKC